MQWAVDDSVNEDKYATEQSSLTMYLLTLRYTLKRRLGYALSVAES